MENFDWKSYAKLLEDRLAILKQLPSGSILTTAYSAPEVFHIQDLDSAPTRKFKHRLVDIPQYAKENRMTVSQVAYLIKKGKLNATKSKDDGKWWIRL